MVAKGLGEKKGRISVPQIKSFSFTKWENSGNLLYTNVNRLNAAVHCKMVKAVNRCCVFLTTVSSEVGSLIKQAVRQTSKLTNIFQKDHRVSQKKQAIGNPDYNRTER